MPVFILDGFEVSVEKIYDMDMNRIESMTILKDAAATALYGSRAANGVVVVTTVAPKPGEMQITYNLTGGGPIIIFVMQPRCWRLKDVWDCTHLL